VAVGARGLVQEKTDRRGGRSRTEGGGPAQVDLILEPNRHRSISDPACTWHIVLLLRRCRHLGSGPAACLIVPGGRGDFDRVGLADNHPSDGMLHQSILVGRKGVILNPVYMFKFEPTQLQRPARRRPVFFSLRKFYFDGNFHLAPYRTWTKIYKITDFDEEFRD
jgi:hypothetical protein